MYSCTLDIYQYGCYYFINLIVKTVDAEITAVMPLQRARVAEIG